MIDFGNSFIKINVSWLVLKEKITLINMPYHYDETEDKYIIFIIDDSVVYLCEIIKVDITWSSDITQEENNYYKLDFETNYKGNANIPFSSVVKKITPTAPSNDYDLKPYGLAHKHIDSSQQVFDITLSNKDGQNIDYSNCSTTPQFYDCIFQNHSEIRDGVSSVDSSTITTFMGRLNEGAAKISRPVSVDHTIEITEINNEIYLWGVFVDAEDYGEDDIGRMQVVDTSGIGVSYGLYTQEEYDYMCSVQSGVMILKEYDECWIRHLAKIIEINTPDGSPGRIMKGFTLRLKYYCKDITKTNIRVWKDYKITIKS